MAGCPIFPKNSHRSCVWVSMQVRGFSVGREGGSVVLFVCSRAGRCQSISRHGTRRFLAAMFLWFFGSCFGSHDEAGLLAFEVLQGLPSLPEARMAGATVEETAFENVDMWQASVSQKQPIMGTEELGTMTLAALQEPQLSFF